MSKAIPITAEQMSQAEDAGLTVETRAGERVLTLDSGRRYTAPLPEDGAA